MRPHKPLDGKKIVWKIQRRSRCDSVDRRFDDSGAAPLTYFARGFKPSFLTTTILTSNLQHLTFFIFHAILLPSIRLWRMWRFFFLHMMAVPSAENRTLNDPLVYLPSGSGEEVHANELWDNTAPRCSASRDGRHQRRSLPFTARISKKNGLPRFRREFPKIENPTPAFVNSRPSGMGIPAHLYPPAKMRSCKNCLSERQESWFATG